MYKKVAYHLELGLKGLPGEKWKYHSLFGLLQNHGEIFVLQFFNLFYSPTLTKEIENKAAWTKVGPKSVFNSTKKCLH